MVEGFQFRYIGPAVDEGRYATHLKGVLHWDPRTSVRACCRLFVMEMPLFLLVNLMEGLFLKKINQ